MLNSNLAIQKINQSMQDGGEKRGGGPGILPQVSKLGGPAPPAPH